MRIVSTATAAVAITASPVLADVTANDVWTSWKTLAESYDQTIEVESDSFSNGVLTLSGVTTTMALPDGGTASGRLGELVLTEQSDGTVAFTMPAEYPFAFTAKGAEGEDMAIAMRFVQEGLEVVASGDPEAISYRFAAPTMSVVLDEITENGTPVEMTLTATLKGTDGTYDVTAGDPQTIDNTFKAEALEFAISVNEPEENVNFQMTATASGIESSSTGQMPIFTGGPEFAQMLRAGLTTEARMTAGPGTFTLAVDDGETPFTMSGGSESATLDMAVTPDGVVYGGTKKGVTATLELGTMPLPPFTLAIAETGGEVRMPLIATDEAKDFGLKMNLTGLEIGESAWAMVDPAGGLPRDPANLALDVSGMGRWAIDISDPAAMAEMTDEVPGEVQSLALNSLLLSVLGAELTGSGDFSFNNASVPPVPSGLVNLRLVGANGVIDKLIATGLLPEDQAMGARMMLGLFARPGGGEDELVSAIEVKEDGSVLANGQRIK